MNKKVCRVWHSWIYHRSNIRQCASCDLLQLFTPWVYVNNVSVGGWETHAAIRTPETIYIGRKK